MAHAQDYPIAVNDSVLTKTLFLSPQDAVNVTRKFPARFTLVDPDPQIWVATLSTFQALHAETVVPVITGSKGGNAALASLLAGLVKLGLVSDSTTA